MEAFRSTLIESLSTDLLIHVIDAADPDIERKMKTVSLVLNELHVGSKPQLLVFNKTDLLSQDQLKELKKRFKNKPAIFISVRNKKDLNTLISEIQKFFVKKDSSFLT